MSSGILLRIIILSLIVECILYLHYKMKLFLMPCISSQPHPNLPVKGVKIWYAHRKSAVTACYCLHVQCAVQQLATAGAGLEHATTHTCPDPASVISQWDNSTEQHAQLLYIRNNTTSQHHNNVLRWLSRRESLPHQCPRAGDTCRHHGHVAATGK